MIPPAAITFDCEPSPSPNPLLSFDLRDPMDACAQLRRDLRDAVAEREREMDLARRRFWLGLLGLDFVLDWEERGSVDRAVSGFLGMVQAGEVYLALRELLTIFRGMARASGRAGAGRVLGRMLGTVALALLVVDVITGYTRWQAEEVNVERRYRARIREIHHETTCAYWAKVFEEEGVVRP